MKRSVAATGITAVLTFALKFPTYGLIVFFALLVSYTYIEALKHLTRKE